jgi:anaerobic C4-dicarboxylate transporter
VLYVVIFFADQTMPELQVEKVEFELLTIREQIGSTLVFWVPCCLLVFVCCVFVLWGNQEWTIQRHWQHWLHKTQYEDKQSTKTQHTKTNKQHGTQNTRVEPKPNPQFPWHK